MSSRRTEETATGILSQIRQRREEMREESLMERRDRLDRELQRDIETRRALRQRQEIERVQREQAQAMQMAERASQAMDREAFEINLRRYILDREQHQYVFTGTSSIQGEWERVHIPWDRQVIRTKMNLSVSIVNALPERGYVNEIVSFEKKLYVYDGHAWNCITKNDSVEPEEIKGRKIVVGE